MSESENRITGPDGEEYVQRKISINDGPKRGRGRPPKTARIRVYNKLRARLFTSDGFLEPESEGEIRRADLDIPGIRDNVLELK